MKNILGKLIVTLLTTAGSGVYVAEDITVLFAVPRRAEEYRYKVAKHTCEG